MKFKALIFCMLACVLVFSACTPKSGDTEEPVKQEYSEPNYYYDFDDILIPRELAYDGSDSSKLDNSKFRAAMMVFSGRVVAEDVVNFFINNMAKDNWQQTQIIKQDKQTMLSFEKHNKSAVITVSDSFAKATVKIFAVETKTTGSAQ